VNTKLRRIAIFSSITLVAVAAGVWRGLAQHEAKITDDPTSDGAAIKTLFGISFENAQGESIPLSKYRGKPLVINFWATWCPPCVEEMPELNEWHIADGNSVSIVGIGIDSPSNVREFVAKNKISYDLLVAGMGGTELSRLLGNSTGALPFTIVISPKETIALKVLGRFSLPALKAAIKTVQANTR
jgi:thiol-disulfide isomerase/thioredoxin